MNEMTSCDSVMPTLSPTLFDLDPLPDSCAGNDQTLYTEDVLPDLTMLEDFMDLTEFYVRSTSLYLAAFFYCDLY